MELVLSVYAIPIRRVAAVDLRDNLPRRQTPIILNLNDYVA